MHGITISNGIAFSPDGHTMYVTDTPVGIIRRFRVGAGYGRLEEIEPLAEASVAPSAPDGAIVDSEGGYWNARVLGGCVMRISPDGKVTDRISLPTKGSTCVALGGPKGNQLYITTLRVIHTEQELEAAPIAGGHFVVEVTVRAQPARLVAL